MVTAVDPDFDIIAMRVDDYLVKPVSREALPEVVDRLSVFGSTTTDSGHSHRKSSSAPYPSRDDRP